MARRLVVPVIRNENGSEEEITTFPGIEPRSSTSSSETFMVEIPQHTLLSPVSITYLLSITFVNICFISATGKVQHSSGGAQAQRNRSEAMCGPTSSWSTPLQPFYDRNKLANTTEAWTTSFQFLIYCDTNVCGPRTSGWEPIPQAALLTDRQTHTMICR